MAINFKTNLRLLAGILGILSPFSVIAGVTARSCPATQRSKCEYGQSGPHRGYYVEPDEVWKLEVEQYFKDQIDHLPVTEQVEKLKKEVKKLRKQLFDISKKANVKMEDDK